MKSILKKLISISLIMCMSIIMLNGFSIKTEAANIELNKYISDTLSYEKSGANVYTFTMPSSGYFYYIIKPVDMTGSWCSDYDYSYIKHEMYANYIQYENVHLPSGLAGIKSYRYNFKKGTKVQIKVDVECFGEGAVPYMENYERTFFYKIMIKTGKATRFEKENNGSKKLANKISLKKAMTGNLLYRDVDYWYFKAPRKGKYKIYGTISNYYTESSSAYLKMLIRTNKKRIGGKLIYNNIGWQKIMTVKLKKNQKIYVQIPFDSWYNMFYKVFVKRIK